MKEGMVILAGAGPGDPGLITVKALEALHSADCVVYDYLSNPEVLEGLSCEMIYVGKQGSDHTLPQEEINALLVRKAREGKTVVRLKGGDPFIFGRGGEEAGELLSHGIRFSIIPGVSSFYAAPAYAGIPITHRDFSNAFEVITGHRRDDAPDEEDINFPDYDPHKTYAFLMGMKNLARIAEKLIKEKNFPAETPVGIISWGTTPAQRVATGTLSDIAAVVYGSALKPPAIIIVGGVVSLRGTLRWFDTLPLFGKRIVVTRTRGQASKLGKKLRGLGAAVIEYPTIEIRPREDTAELDRALGELDKFRWIVFTSQNAVNIFFSALHRTGLDARSLHGCRIAVIGPATAAEIEKYFITPELVPVEYVAEAVIEEFRKLDTNGVRILLPCAAEARETLKDGLSALGALVERIHIYDTVPPAKVPEGLSAEAAAADIITFASSSTARNFFALVPETKAKLASIGPVTSAAIKELGHTVDIEAKDYTIDGLVEAIVEQVKSEG